MLRRLLALLLFVAPVAYAIENVTVDSLSRNVINLGAVNFATGQLKVSGIAVVGGGGGGGGGGGTIDNVRLNLPTAVFVSPVDYVISGGLAEGTVVLAPQSANTVFANLTGSSATPTFVTVAALKTGLALDNVNNTSDAAKPISTATQSALDTLTANVATNTASIASLTTSVAAKADTAAMTTALAAKASITYVDTQDATKQNSWGLPSVNGYIAAGNTNGTLFWVNPTTLGTTSATYTDGVTNSTTTLTSATAGFTSTDVGKTVTGSGIPGSTTISAVNSATSVTLSAAATTSVNPLTFVILNRFAGGGGGTVTLFTSGNLSPLFTTSIASGASTPNQSFSLSNAAANTFFGNGTALSAAPTFMDATTARGALGGTTIGQNLFTLTNPSTISFPRFNADNTLTARDAAGFRTDIGAGTVTSVSATNNVSSLLGISVTSAATSPVVIFDPVNAAANTFYGNGTGSSAAPTFMSASTARAALGGTTVGQNFFQLANPSAITYPRISAANTVTAAAPATVLADIGAASSTDTRFPASVIGIRKGAGAASTDTAATANIDYAKDSEMLTGATGDANGTWTAGATVWRQSAALTAPRTGTLPAANAYASGTVITYIDALTTGNFGRAFSRAGADTLNGGSAAITPFIAGGLGFNGSKVAYFETNGLDAWRTLGAGIVDHIENATDARQSFVFDASLQSFNIPGAVTAANGPSVTVKPTDPSSLGFVRDIDTTGVGIKNQVRTAELLPVEETIGTAGNTIAATSSVVTDTNPGTVDTVRIAGTLTGPYTITWPAAGHYSSGETVVLLDASGSVSPSHPVTVISAAGNTFNLGSAVVFNETDSAVRKAFTSDGNNNWSIPTAKTSIQGFAVQNGPSFSIVGDSSAVKHNAQLNLSNGANTLNVSGRYDGMSIELVLVQPSSGAAGTLSLPSVSAVSGGGAGVITLTATNGAVDRVRGVYDTSLGMFLWDAPILNHTTSAVPSAPTLSSVTGINAARVDLVWTNVTNETGYTVERADGTSGTAFNSITTQPVNTTTYSDTTVHAASPYNYRVKAFNSGGSSVASNSIGVTTAGGGPGADVWELHLNENSGTTTNATVPVMGGATLAFADWTTATQNPGTANPAAFAPIAGMVSSAGTVTAVPTGGGTGANYVYHVLAYKNAGSHNTSGQNSAIVNQISLDASHFNTVSWTAVTGADWYRVDRASGAPVGQLTNSTTGTVAALCTGGTCTFVDSNTGAGSTLGSILSNTASTDAHIITANAPVIYSPTSNTAISISFWVKSTFSGGAANIIAGGGSGSNVFTISQQSANKLQVSFNGTSGAATQQFADNVGPVTALNDNNWHHVVCVLDNTGISYNATNDIKVYYDGNATPRSFTSEPVKSRTGPSTFTTSTPIIGSGGFVGSIDDIRIYARALTTTETASLFTGNAQ